MIQVKEKDVICKTQQLTNTTKQQVDLEKWPPHPFKTAPLTILQYAACQILFSRRFCYLSYSVLNIWWPSFPPKQPFDTCIILEIEQLQLSFSNVTPLLYFQLLSVISHWVTTIGGSACLIWHRFYAGCTWVQY